MKTKLGVDHFTVVVEDDGSDVCSDVMTAIIEDGEKLGTSWCLRMEKTGHEVYYC